MALIITQRITETLHVLSPLYPKSPFTEITATISFIQHNAASCSFFIAASHQDRPSLIFNGEISSYYVLRHFDAQHPIDNHLESSLLHELIHALDYQELQKTTLLTPSPMDLFVKYLLTFRHEGIATLFTQLTEVNNRKRHLDAKTSFLNELEHLEALLLESPSIDDLRECLNNFSSFYSYGSWLILQFLKSRKLIEVAYFDELKLKLESGITIAPEEALPLIALALTISSTDFYKFITALFIKHFYQTTELLQNYKFFLYHAASLDKPKVTPKRWEILEPSYQDRLYWNFQLERTRYLRKSVTTIPVLSKLRAYYESWISSDVKELLISKNFTDCHLILKLDTGEEFTTVLTKKLPEPKLIHEQLIDDLFQSEFLFVDTLCDHFLQLEPIYLLRFAPRLFTEEASRLIAAGQRYNLSYLKRMLAVDPTMSSLPTQHAIQVRLKTPHALLSKRNFSNFNELAYYLNQELPLLLLRANSEDKNLASTQLITQNFPHAHEFYEAQLKWRAYVATGIYNIKFSTVNTHINELFKLRAEFKLVINL